MRIAAVLAVALLAGAAAPRSAAEAERYRQCLEQARSAPAQAADTASAWRVEGGGLPARHCLAMALLGRGQPVAAAAELEAAAREAEAARDAMAAELYGQAGNAALIAGDAARAQALLSSGILVAGGDAQARAALLGDRARAAVQLGQTAEARRDLDQALALVPTDATARLLRGTLARREGDLATARADLAEARRLRPTDPDVLLEAGNLAIMGGDLAAARALWRQVAAEHADAPQGRAAARALAINPES